MELAGHGLICLSCMIAHCLWVGRDYMLYIIASVLPQQACLWPNLHDWSKIQCLCVKFAQNYVTIPALYVAAWWENLHSQHFRCIPWQARLQTSTTGTWVLAVTHARVVRGTAHFVFVLALASSNCGVFVAVAFKNVSHAQANGFCRCSWYWQEIYSHAWATKPDHISRLPYPHACTAKNTHYLSTTSHCVKLTSQDIANITAERLI